MLLMEAISTLVTPCIRIVDLLISTLRSLKMHSYSDTGLKNIFMMLWDFFVPWAMGEWGYLKHINK